MVVRPGDRPAFWLHVPGASAPVELELSAIDALALLVSERTDVAVEVAGAQRPTSEPAT